MVRKTTKVVLFVAILLVLSVSVSAADATPTSCGDVDSDLTLTANIDNTAGGSCFVVTSDSIIIDGGGYEITGVGAYGIDLSSVENVTVKNFGLIYNFTHGVAINSGGNHTIFNNTINTTDSGALPSNVNGSAIGISGSRRNNITHNTLRTTGNLAAGVTILGGTTQDTITNNDIETHGNTASGVGYFSSTSSNQLIDSNTMVLYGSGGSAINFYAPVSDSNISNNNLTIESGSTAAGISLGGAGASTYNVITNNTVDISSDEDAIELSGGSSYNNITFNTVTSSGQGLELDGVDYIRVISNRFTQTGSTSSVVELLNDADYIQIRDNNITGSSSADDGIDLDGSYNVIHANNITAQTPEKSGINMKSSSMYNNITSNTIDSQAEGINQANACGCNHTIISSNTITATGYDLKLQDSQYITLLDQYIENFTIINGIDFTIEDTNEAKIFFRHELGETGENFSNSIQLNSNSVRVNITALTNINLSANITIYNTDALGYSNNTPFLAGSECHSSICTELTDADAYVFNVTSFDADKIYSVGAGLADSDNDGITDNSDTLLGTESSITATGLPNLEINISGASPSGTFSGKQTVSVNSSGKLIMNFTHDFSDITLDLSRVTITNTGSTILVNMSGQINYTKTLWIDDSGLVSLCAKDAAITSLSEISAGCTGSNEYDFTSCIGSPTAVVSGPLTCVDEGSRIRIENLSHSGVRGTQGARFTGIEVTKGETGSFTESTAGNDTSQGGNLTILNFSSDASTIKWQGYYGETEVSLAVGVGGNTLFSFGSAPNEQIKSVMATTDNNFNFPQIQAATAGDIDTTWGFSATDSDSGTLTLDDGTAVIAGVTGVPYASLNAYTSSGTATTYQSGVVKDDGSVAESSFGTLGFIVSVVPDQTDFANNTQVDFELIVPVNNTAGSQTYYFFLDIS